MILKYRKKPPELRKLAAVVPRLRPNHPNFQQAERELAIRNKGHRGEKKVDYHLKQLAKSFTILQDVGLTVNNQNFQIDTIVISNHALYIIETKHISGTVIFNTNLNQFTQQNGHNEIGLRCPITQVEAAKFKLQNWLDQRNLGEIPIHCFVGISDPSTIISVKGDEAKIARIVAHGEHIPNKIFQADQALAIKKQSTEKWDHHQIGLAILKECKEIEINILDHLDITPHDLLPGIICPKCDMLKMERTHGMWTCTKCEFRSKLAHIKALSDFRLLIKPTITNRECRWWLQVNSRHIATYLLMNAKLHYHKGNKVWIKQ